MEKSTINKLITHFQNAFQQLNISLDNSQYEHLSLLIYGAMVDSRKRIFHTPVHINKVCKDLKSPLQLLAGLFHDIIYYQIDGGFPSQLRKLIANYTEIKEQDVFIKRDVPKDILFELCLDVFHFERGQKLLIFSGLNEFLSALAAVKTLEKYLTVKDLLCIIACIEATIPFRMENEEGLTNLEQLEVSLKAIRDKHQIYIKEEEIVQFVKLAAELANYDVENFADTDVGRFLDNTWRLLPETNDALWTSDVYSLSSYRKALMKMEMFLSYLNPDSVFHQYKGVPTPEAFEQIRRQAHQNLAIAREYMGAKLISIAIVEAFAVCTGGDAPISMFIGDIRNAGIYEDIARAEDFLPAVKVSEHLQYDPSVLKLLEFGRASDLNFDMQNAPISYFIYASAGAGKMKEYLSHARQMFDEKISAEEFLNKIDKPIFSAIARACAEITITRRDILQRFF